MNTRDLIKGALYKNSAFKNKILMYMSKHKRSKPLLGYRYRFFDLSTNSFRDYAVIAYNMDFLTLI